MPATTSRSFLPMPSFGSVFGGDLHTLPNRECSSAHGSSNVASSTTTPFSSFHIARDSRDSNSTASSDNSPTTTISTMDSSSVTDPSPGPSPESPMAKLNPSFAADFRARRTDVPGDSSPNFFELQRPTTPAKKARNLKNLGINTTTSLTNLRAQPPAPLAPGKEKNSSAPPSPLFIKPPTPPRRRPSNLSLTIATPGINDSKPTRLVIPSTPSLSRPALRHFQSSPSLPLCSPSVAPAGGMQFPSLRPIATKNSGLSEVPFEMEEEEDQEPNFDVPQSREEKPAAYPNGPICIYPAGVYLYFEPTAEQAATFDVIVNVASEVQNPFTTPVSESQKKLNARRVDGPAAENVDFAALSKQQPKTSFDTGSNSPTTPKATPVLQTMQPGEIVLNGKKYRTPEYIHMPWEHNTDIVPDLYKLVKIMDDRVKQGKRVLVHCQCGVSRSASLVVAYGLYKEPEVSVQEAYDKAKKRSKWIGPNMNLIMQLQEFRNGLLRQNQTRSYHDKAFSRRSMGFPTAGPKDPSFERDNDSGSRTPRTAPLPPDSDISMQRASTGNMMAISPGPLSAPSGAFAAGFRRSWDSSQAHFGGLPASTTTPYVDPKGHVVPVVEVNDGVSIEEPGLAPEFNVPQLQAPPTPSALNFTRQLPLRMQDDSEQESSAPASSTLKETHLAPMKRLGFGALKSPAARSFHIPSIQTEEEPNDEVMSPVKTTFDIPWPREYDEPEQSTSTLKVQESSAPLKSPRFGGFPLNPLKSFRNLNTDDSDIPPSPSAASFGFSQTLHAPHQEPSGFSSPLVSQFPKDVFGPPDDVLDEEMKSPRATEFHMTPLKPRTTVDDPFGLTSPTRFDFPGKQFGRPRSLAQAVEADEDRRPSFQAILPPAHQNFNGFASLDGTTRTGSPGPFYIQPPTPKNIDVEPRASGLTKAVASSSEPQLPSQMKEPLPTQPTEPLPSQTPQEIPQERSNTPRTTAFLSTPAKTIRTRFSSPNMKQQRELSKLQFEMQTKLPPAAIQHSADDLDALMSPRAEEFTRNPFHFEVRPTSKDGSPTSSNETITDGRNGHTWNEPVRQWTPEKPAIDPRSPAHLGSSPIVRNIWDVL